MGILVAGKKRMKNLRNDDEPDPTDQSEQKKLITDPILVKEMWLKKASEEIWLKKILPGVNPFLAMDTFRGVQRIASALASDRTEDGRILWIRYINLFRGMIRPITIRPDDVDDELLNYLETVEGIEQETVDQVEEIIISLRKTFLGYEKGIRNSFMWLWLLCKLLSKERAKQLEQIIGSNANREISSLGQIIQYRVPENTKILYPFHLEIKSVKTGTVIDEIMSASNVFQIIKMYGMFTADVQYAMYRIAGPVIDMIFYSYTLFSFYNYLIRTRKEEIATYLLHAQTQDSVLVCHLISDVRVSNPQLPQYIMTEDFYKSIRTVTGTYPTNPEVGPGIYTGNPVCMACNVGSARLICSGCNLSVFCSDCNGKCGNCVGKK